MSRRIGLYIILAVFLFTISTVVVSAASNQMGLDSLTNKQKEEIKALVDQQFQSQKEQIKKEVIEEMKKNQDNPKASPKDSTAPDAHNPQLKLLK